jgi:hypothetical protein
VFPPFKYVVEGPMERLTNLIPLLGGKNKSVYPFSGALFRLNIVLEGKDTF